MSYNVTSLPAYTSEQSRKFMLKSILGGKTIEFLTEKGSFDPTAMGNTAIQLLETDVVWQDGSVCKLSELGSVALAQNVLVVQPIAMKFPLCARTLVKTYAVEDLKAKQRGENGFDDALFIEHIGDDVASKNQAEIEKLVWQGDKTKTGNMKFIDGFLKQLATGTFDLSTITGADIVAELQNAYLAMPIEVRDQEDFRIFLGKEVYDKYKAVLAGKNIYQAVDDNTLFGTTAIFQIANGLNGTNKAVYSRARNLQTGGDLKSTELEHWYSKDDDEVKVQARFSLGATAIYKQEIGVLDVA